MQTYKQPVYPADHQARELVLAAEKVDLPNLFPYLVIGHGPVIAAKNIRKELKAAFVNIKFSVRTEKFSMGNAVRIDWTDGPTRAQVEAIYAKYLSGDFDGMTDSYRHNTTGFNALFGSAKYITTCRDYSDEFITRCVAEVVAEFGGDPITAKQYSEGGGHLWRNRQGVDLGRELNIKTSNTPA